MSVILAPRLQPAVLEVVREARLDVPESARAAVLRFYCDVFALPRWPEPRQLPGGLGLGSPRKGLWLRWRHDFQPDPARRRLTLRVQSLDLTARQLRARGWEPRWRAGLQALDRVLLVNDPAGHLIEIRAQHHF